jgi:16S rRNA (guanine527-N7)-methyltransferase
VTGAEFRQRLSARAAAAGLTVSGEVADALETYYRLLARWNAKINLTALALDPPTDKTFDRLLIEPLAAARHVADSARTWIDIGSGGGSPAIPLKIARPELGLRMIESKQRKAVFLQEATVAIGIEGAAVIASRVEDTALRIDSASIDLVTVRGVRADSKLFSAIRRLISPSGEVFLFHAGAAVAVPAMLAVKRTVELLPGGQSHLIILAGE